jgi:hypothetical protein
LSELCKLGSKKWRKASWIVKRFGKYRRKSKLNSEKIGKIWKKGKLNTETSINSFDISFMYILPRYNCNIVECGIKHHKPNPLITKTYTYLSIYLHFYQNYLYTDICLPLAGKYILKPC